MKPPYLIIALILTASGTLTACNNSKEPAAAAVQQSEPQTPTQVSIKNNTAVEDVSQKIHLQANSIMSSGDKLIFNSEVLKKGDIVFNQTMQQKGVVTGTLVLTLASDFVPKDLANNFNLIRSTAHNYMLLVTQDDNIKAVAKSLSAYSDVKNVEVSVNYSPIETQF
ncbi:hypothetical protein [Pseudoalteromonas sp. BSi20495]|uniref:hypothetical protein n=1 Tax=Pseudoalteromonas sp. BSi20495 TaxID=386429 RepID=UPI0002315BBF|nr:hypothetical protein [Pseudoalteromonas sp. BSi20495]GAA81724.1 hypothetical protein P20495_4264 [Pseudoalteromonas sp. BSi20495]